MMNTIKPQPITENIILNSGVLQRTITVSGINTSKKYPGHVQMATKTDVYNTPEGQVTIVEDAIYIATPFPVNPPVIS